MAVQGLAPARGWRGILRRPHADRAIVAAAAGQGVVVGALLAGAHDHLVPLPVAASCLAVALWWNANTIAHIHIHTPLFRSRRLNHWFAVYLTGLTCIPQSIWRARHLWHHAGEPMDRPPRVAARRLAFDLALIAAVCGSLAWAAPAAFFGAWLPGYLIGLGLCQLHGRFEHAGAPVGVDPGVSCYNPLYNRLWINDGYHAEHHRWPGLHWACLPGRRLPDARASAWPPVLRWLDGLGRLANRAACSVLDRLEALALGSPRLQRYLLDRHARSLARLLAVADVRHGPRVGIVGGGLFPRTVVLVAGLLPESDIVIIESRRDHADRARAFLDAHGVPTARISFVHGTFDAAQAWDFDVLIVPLGYRGNRGALYHHPPAPVTLVHDWLWCRRGQAGVVVSPVLLKRLNLAIGARRRRPGLRAGETPALPGPRRL